MRSAPRGVGFVCSMTSPWAARVYQTDCIASPLNSVKSRNPNVLVIDLDVHQGDGTAEILASDPSVFTFSMHGATNYPFTKVISDLDIALPDGTGDEFYLTQLQDALIRIESGFKPDLILYVAGLDVHEADRLGKLALTDSGIQWRDQIVLAWAAKHGLPVAAVMAGGYFPDLAHLTDLQLGVVKRLAEYGEHYVRQVYLRNNSNWTT